MPSSFSNFTYNEPFRSSNLITKYSLILLAFFDNFYFNKLPSFYNFLRRSSRKFILLTETVIA